jgi:hypothetical protein
MEIGNSKPVEEREDAGTIVFVKDELGEPAFDGEGDAKRAVTIRVVGTYSPTYRRARRKVRDKNLKTIRNDYNAETLEDQETAIAAECIIEWSGFTIGGRPFELTPKNAFALLKSHPWIYEQVFAAMNDHASFSTAPSPS